MRLRPQHLAITSFAAFLTAVCVPACAPDTSEEEVESSDSNLTLAACPCSGGLSRGWFNGHDGVDIAASYGTPIYAVQGGVVTDSGPAQGYGQWIRIRHEDGSMTEYGHMQRRDVRAGQKVSAGQQIAAVGSEGQSTGPHLHLRTYRRAGDARGMDPKVYLSARGITLPCKGGATTAPKGTQCAGGGGSVVGEIEKKYKELGGCGSTILGLPVTDELGSADKVGRYNDFQKGVIYWSPSTGAHEIHGAIHELWEKMQWETGPLGYPTTDEAGTPDARGRYSVFQRGSIYWTETTGAHAVLGAIRDKYKELGWEAGALGYPTSDEYGIPGGRKSDFEHGSITWDAATGETKVLLNEDVAPKDEKDGGN